jgi:NADH-quinone oxidoreductase subunit C
VSLPVVAPALGAHSWPAIAAVDGIAAHLRTLLGDAVIEIVEHAHEVGVTVRREGVVEAVTALRDDPALRFNQLVDICGVDYPDRAERFDVVYQLLSMAKNLRLRVKVTTDTRTPVPSLTGLFPNAGWYERETWDCYGVLFSGNADLRRILTDYGFEGHPFRKDFPLTGHVELRYSEEHKRVVYEPVKLAQDFRSFDFLSPWEGTDYVLPGDEKAGDLPKEHKRA